MRTTTLRELRQTLDATIDTVDASHEPVMVTRDGGEPAAVLISVEDFESLEATAHLVGNPRNAGRLIGSIERLERGLGTEREIPE